MFDRVVAAALGGIAGAVLYFGFDLLSHRYGIGSGHWSFSGGVRWFVVAGVIIGFIGGRGVASNLWAHAVDEVRGDASWTIGLGLVIILVLCVFGFSMYLSHQ